jgi:hypothetical protein
MNVDVHGEEGLGGKKDVAIGAMSKSNGHREEEDVAAITTGASSRGRNNSHQKF